MSQNKIRAKELAVDIKSGSHLSELLNKYNIPSLEKLEGLCDKLISHKLLSDTEKNKLFNKFVCPACGFSKNETYSECPSCGIIIGKFKIKNKQLDNESNPNYIEKSEPIFETQSEVQLSKQKKIIVKNYKGSHYRATSAFEIDSEKLAEENYFPISQTWAQGAWGCGHFLLALFLFIFLIGIIIFVYMLIFKPAGVLTVTYELRPDTVILTDKKKCPKCAEKVNFDAKICRYCRYEFVEINPVLSNCNKCGKQIPINTNDCPHCDQPKIFKQIKNENDNKEKKSKSTLILLLSKSLGWSFGIIFVAVAFGSLFSSNFITCLSFLIIAIILIPPILPKLNIHLSFKQKLVVFFICYIGGSIFQTTIPNKEIKSKNFPQKEIGQSNKDINVIKTKSSQTSPSVSDFTIIEREAVRNIKCSLTVRLNKKVSEDYLESLAKKLRFKEPIKYERMFIFYYLPGMVVGSGAWATTHFNPDLKVEILGTSIEEENKLVGNSSIYEGQLIGEWIDDFMGSKYTFTKINGKILMECHFKDGSVSKIEMIKNSVSGSYRYEEKSKNDFGEYYKVDNSGNLDVYDNAGFIRKFRKI